MDRTRVFAQGLIAGLAGYAAVALVCAIANVLVGRSPFFTAALLGEAMFYGLTDPHALTVHVGPVLAFNGLHLVIFLVLGLLASALAELAERGPQFWYASAVVFIFVMLHMFGGMLFFTRDIREAVPPAMVLIAALAAGGVMGAVLLGGHPRLRAELRERPA